MTKTRDLYWDTVKFILIFLVLYGHFIQPFRENSPFNMTMFNFRYTFHMSLFVFISGRFSHISDPKKYRKGILKIIETYVVFQCALCLTSYLMGEKLYWGMLTTPRFALWYLVALLYYRVFVYLFDYKRITPPTPIPTTTLSATNIKTYKLHTNTSSLPLDCSDSFNSYKFSVPNVTYRRPFRN